MFSDAVQRSVFTAVVVLLSAAFVSWCELINGCGNTCVCFLQYCYVSFTPGLIRRHQDRITRQQPINEKTMKYFITDYKTHAFTHMYMCVYICLHSK